MLVRIADHITNLSIAERGPRAIVLQWSTEESVEEAKFHVEYQVNGNGCQYVEIMKEFF